MTESSAAALPTVSESKTPFLKASVDVLSASDGRPADRAIPASEMAEKGLLGSMLISPNDVLTDAIAKVRPGFFYYPKYRIIYEELIRLWQSQTPIDLVSVTQTLKDAGLIDQIGGYSVLPELFRYVPTAANAAYYIDILQEKHLLREVIRTCSKFTEKAYEEQEDVPSLIDAFEAGAYEINNSRLQKKETPFSERVMEAVDSIEKLFDSKGELEGLSTGFGRLDDLTRGLRPSEMFVIAARPSMGKTALAMNIVEHVALVEKKPVAVFSLEMSTQQLVQRLLYSLGEVNANKVSRGIFSNNDFENLVNAASKLRRAEIFIDDTASIPILELRAKARRLKMQHDIQLVVIDYLQLIAASTRKAKEGRHLEIAEVSAGVKALAKELEIPVLVLAQLNRQSESRGGEARLSDLRESGSIEQDADVVGLLMRLDYFKTKGEEDSKETEGFAELNIAKNRNGPTGEVPLLFVKDFARFEMRPENAQPSDKV